MESKLWIHTGLPKGVRQVAQKTGRALKLRGAETRQVKVFERAAEDGPETAFRNERRMLQRPWCQGLLGFPRVFLGRQVGFSS